MRRGMGVLTVLAVLGVVLGSTGEVGAVPIPIVNPSFEFFTQTIPPFAPPLSDGQFTTQPNAVTGWTHDGTAGTWNPFAAAYPSTGGNVPAGGGLNAAYSNGGPLVQVLADVLTPDTTYTLEVFVGRRADSVGGVPVGFPGYLVELFANSTPLVQCNSCVIPTSGTFAPVTLTFTSPSVVTPGQFLGIGLDSFGEQTNWDLVSLDASPAPAAVPEPGTLWLIGSGLAGIGVLHRKRWFKSADT